MKIARLLPTTINMLGSRSLQEELLNTVSRVVRENLEVGKIQEVNTEHHTPWLATLIDTLSDTHKITITIENGITNIYTKPMDGVEMGPVRLVLRRIK